MTLQHLIMITQSKIFTLPFSGMALILVACTQQAEIKRQEIFNAQGEIAGEVTQTSVILQSRLTGSDTLVEGDMPGTVGMGRFEWSKTRDFPVLKVSPWLTSSADQDFILKMKIEGLETGTKYYYRLRFGKDTINTFLGEERSFQTLPAVDSDDPLDFIVTSCYNYHRFHFGRIDQPEKQYKGEDKALGYPALEVIKSLTPGFVVFTGDNVYYDTPQTDALRAKTPAQLRKKWHEQLVQPRFIALFSEVATYWEKDDHDHRFNDSDTLSNFKLLEHLMLEDKVDSASLRLPSHKTGIAVFREQVPVVDPNDPGAVTYRTYRLNKHVQVWFTENRDYRSPNDLPDGPGKTIWGEAQKQWLKETLLTSDANFKLLISATPLVGPDDAYKNDNHVNHKGFRHEGESFLNWVKENTPDLGKFIIVHGDRHWQYHSVHPLGIEEFSVGAIDDSNARKPRLPGDPASTDPGGAIVQPYVIEEESGGFLRIRSGIQQGRPSLLFTFYNEKGSVLYETMKLAENSL